MIEFVQIKVGLILSRNIKTGTKVSLLGVDLLWGDCTFNVYSGRLGVIAVDLCYFALFEDFSLYK